MLFKCIEKQIKKIVNDMFKKHGWPVLIDSNICESSSEEQLTSPEYLQG